MRGVRGRYAGCDRFSGRLRARQDTWISRQEVETMNNRFSTYRIGDTPSWKRFIRQLARVRPDLLPKAEKGIGITLHSNWLARPKATGKMQR